MKHLRRSPTVRCFIDRFEQGQELSCQNSLFLQRLKSGLEYRGSRFYTGRGRCLRASVAIDDVISC